MGREYSSKRTSRQRGSAPQQFLVIIVSFLLGYFTATVFDVEKISHWMNNQVLDHQEVKKQPVKKAEAQQSQLPPKPKFEFYTLLANEKPNGVTQSGGNVAANHATNTPAGKAAAVAASTVAAAKPNTANPQQRLPVKVAEGKPLFPVPANKGSYLVQVAAFKVRHDAEHMKGLLILKGFNVNVVQINQPLPRGVWFRVVVGPYSNKVLAQKAQINLARNERLRGMVISG